MHMAQVVEEVLIDLVEREDIMINNLEVMVVMEFYQLWLELVTTGEVEAEEHSRGSVPELSEELMKQIDAILAEDHSTTLLPDVPAIASLIPSDSQTL